MSIFAKIREAKVYSAGQYFKPGSYEVEIDKVAYFQSDRNAGKWYFVVETRVVSTTSEYKAGESVSWLQDLSKMSSLGNVKQFALSLTPGATEQDITEEVMETLCAPEQPAAGLRIGADVVTRTSKEGRDYTLVQWRVAAEPSGNSEEIPF
jgi:hypothetical protein